MLPVVFVGKWQPAVATGADLWLVRVDKYPRVASRAAAAVAGDYAIMRPSDRLLVHQLHGRVGLWLKAKVCLLETRPCHGLGARLLAPSPDVGAVRGLERLGRLRGWIGGLGRCLCLGGCDGGGRVQLTGRDGKCASRKTNLARQMPRCPKTRSGHHLGRGGDLVSGCW